MNLFNILQEIQPKLPGWCNPLKALTLASIVIARRPACSVEIGVYGGSSFIAIAVAHQLIGYGKAIGIDAWDNQVAVAAQTENESREWWANQDLEKIYQDLFALLDLHGMGNVAQLVRQQSNRVTPPNSIGLLHVDGGHNDQAITDVVRFAPRVEPGGFVVTDDTNWTGGGVQRAEAMLITMKFRKLYALGTGAVFVRA